MHLLPTTQSGYRRGHSTETATIRVLSDLLDAVDREDTAALVLLDLTAAFDTVDHELLLERLRVTFGVDNSALAWFQSYLAGRTQHVRCGGKCSTLIDIICGMDRSFSLFIPLIWRRSLLNTDCRYTSMPMTVKDMVPASLMPHLLCRPTSQNVLMTCTAGCG